MAGERYIKAALRFVEEHFGSKEARALLVMAPLKRGVEDRNDVLRAVADARGESIANTRREYAGWTPGAVFRAQGAVDAYLFDADTGLVSPGGGSYEPTGDVNAIGPEAIRWAQAVWLTTDGEDTFALSDWRDYLRAMGF